MAAHGHFHWNELMTRDIDRAKKFYADTLGWTYEAMQSLDGSTYWLTHMSCRLAVNMAKRAAAGAMSVSAWSEEETECDRPHPNRAAQ